MKKLVLILLTIHASLFTLHSLAQHEYEFREQNLEYSHNVYASENVFKGSINPDFIIDSVYQIMEQGHIPGVSLCVVHGSEPMWVHHLGWANIEDSIPVSDSTIFQLASISKPVVATAIMQLWELDSLNLDDNVSDYLPFEVKNPNCPDESITFFQLLIHISSINDNWYGEMEPLVVFGSDSPIQLDTFLYHYLLPGGTYYDSISNFNNFTPGAAWDYSNVGFALLGYLVECISGISFEEYCQQHIFEPLGMNNTSWFQANLNTNNIAMQYKWQGGQYIPYGLSGMPYYPCGQLRCTPLDLAKFLSANINYGTYNGYTMLDSSTMELITTIYYSIPVANKSQGLGWRFDHTYGVWKHLGGWFGVLTMACFDKENHWGTMELSNGDLYTSSVPLSETIDDVMIKFSKQHHPLSLDSIYLSDSTGDFILEPGEDVTLHLGLRNNTNITNIAENVTLQLSSTDPSVASISDPDISFGDIVYNQTVFNITDSLKFTMGNSLTSSKVNFSVTISWNDEMEYVSDFELKVGSAEILLVKDETDWRSNLIQTENWYLQVLDSLGYSVYYYDLSLFGDPHAEFLSNFPAVIWYTGYDLENTITENNQQVLAEYLDNGGQLFLSGQNISDELAGTNFLNNYLHTSHIADTWDGIEIIEGVEGDPIGYELVCWINLGDGVNGHNSMSVVGAIGGGYKVFNYYSTENGAATRYENETYKTVFFAFGFETINEFENRYEIMNRILNEYFLITGEEEINLKTIANNNIQVLPNPFTSTTSISYSIQEKSFVNIKIYDISGQVIYEPINEFQLKGVYSKVVDESKLKPGVYFCVLKSNEGVQTKKIIKL